MSCRWIQFHLYGMPTTRPLSGFLPKLGEQRHRPTNSQILLKPEGDVFVAGSDSAQHLLALCHAVVSDPWCLAGRFQGLIARATRHPEKKPPAWAGGFCLCRRVAA
jgi:hypothetical protein